MSADRAIVVTMNWADAIEVALHVVPKRVAQILVLGLLAYIAITRDATPFLWWVQQIADGYTELLLPALLDVVQPA